MDKGQVVWPWIITIVLFQLKLELIFQFLFMSDEEKLSPTSPPKWNSLNRLINLEPVQFFKSHKSYKYDFTLRVILKICLHLE